MRKRFTRRAIAAAVLLIVLLFALVWPLHRPGLRVGQPLPPGKVAPQLATGWDTAVLLAPDGSLWTWGSNLHGQLGDGTTSNRWTPVRIGQDRDWRTVAAGGDGSYALKLDGTLWGWGPDFAIPTLTPSQIAPGTNWLAIAADSGNLLVALKTDGTLWLRGRRFNLLATHVDAGGVDGLKQVGSANDWAAVYAGPDLFFARKQDGS